MANVTVSSTIDTLLQSADAAEAKTAISAATAGSVSALSSNALVLAEKEWPIKTVTWATNQTLTYTGGTDTAGDGVIIQANVTTQFVLTVTPTSSTIYRNGAVTSLSGTITVPVGKHRFVFWTPDDGTTLYMEDTVFAAVDVPVAATPSNYTAATPDVEAHLAGIDTALASAGGGVYTIPAFTTVLMNMTSSTTYYLGGISNTLTTNSGKARSVAPVAGTVTGVILILYINGTLGTTENSTLTLLKNGSSAGTLSSAVQWSTNPKEQTFSGLSVAVSAGDLLQIKIDTPAWSTVPTSVVLMATFVIQT